MSLAAVLFDLDGTLVDSLPLILNTYELVFRELGLAWQPEAVRDMVGLPLRSIARTFAGDRDGDFLRLYQHHYFADHDRFVRAFPWTADLLDALRELRLGVVTSKGRAGTDRTLEFTRLADRFEVVVTAEDSASHKPEPGPVLAALRSLGVAAPAAAYAGDSPFDIMAGRAAGTLTAGVTWGAAGRGKLAACRPDVLCGEWQELVDFLRA